jgi:phosphatidylglycerophosphate synthase
MGEIADIYRLTRKSPDLFWNTWVCRPPAAIVVWILRGTGVTPNQVTLAAFALALVAAALLVVLPGHAGLLLAVLAFELSYVLDCADGMLARLRGTQSVQGGLFDFLMDELKAFAMLAAACVRLFREGDDPRWLLLGIVGLVCLASGVALTTFLRRPEIAGPTAPAAPPAPLSLARRVVGLIEGAAKFLIHYPSYVLYAALAGRIELYVFPYVAVNAAYFLRTLAQVAIRFGR